jgi:outer membrane protein TolC
MSQKVLVSAVTIVTCLLIVSTSAFGQMQLEGYLEMAAEQNPTLKSRFNLYLAALEQVDQEGALPDPTVSFGYFISPVETRVGPQRFRLSLSQMFPWKGTLKVKGQAAASRAKTLFYEFEEARNQLFLKVRHKWLELYELKQEIEIMQANLELLRSYEPVTKTKYEANLVSLADLIRVQISIDNAVAQLELLQMKHKPLVSDFNLLLNRDPSRDVYIADTLGTATEAMYHVDSVKAGHPIMERLRTGLETLEYSEALAALKRKPNIGFGLDYGFIGRRSDATVSDNGKDILMPQVSVSLPVFGKKNKAFQREIALKKESYEAQLTATGNELSNDWVQAEYQMESARRELELYQEEIDKMNVLLRVLTSEYSNNNRDFEELLKTQQQLLQLRLAQVRAIVKYHHGMHQKDYLTGYTLNRIK